MGATFSRIKNWTTEVLSNTDLNAEIDNILNNLGPAGVDDYSTTVTQMRTNTDPGESGTESLATSLSGEIERLRFVIKEMKGTAVTYWYESSNTSLTDLNNAVGGGLSSNRMTSGRVRSGSQQPIFLVPNGAARTIKIDGTPTAFTYYINGIQYSITADVTLTGLTAAPSSNATCSLNDAGAADQEWTKYVGENGGALPVDGMDSEITALVGKLAGFSLNNGASTEYFMAHVNSTSSLTKVRRGFFFDSADAPIPRVAWSNNDEVRLMKLTWVYATTANTVTATYNNPTWGKDEPPSPAVGDFWYDTDNSAWKTYSVGSWTTAAATLVGVCLQNTAATVAARSFEFALGYTDLNTFELFAESNTQVKTREPGGMANIWGTKVSNDHGTYTWDMTLDLDTGVTESANTQYFFYLTEEGDKIISDVRPYDRTEDLGGWYHPHNSWRAIGSARNDGSSNLTDIVSYYNRRDTLPLPIVETAYSTVEILDRIIRVNPASAAFAKTLPPASLWRGQVINFWKTTDNFSAVTVSMNGTAVSTLNTLNEFVSFVSDGTIASVLDRRVPAVWSSFAATTNLTVGVISAQYQRLGDTLKCRYHFDWAAAESYTAVDVSLPSGLTIDTAKLPYSTTLRVPVGPTGYFVEPGGGTTPYLFQPVYKNTTTISHKYVLQISGASTVVYMAEVSGSSPVAATASTTLDGQFEVPIVGWNG